MKRNPKDPRFATQPWQKNTLFFSLDLENILLCSNKNNNVKACGNSGIGRRIDYRSHA
jgi:hypothetical protein